MRASNILRTLRPSTLGLSLGNDIVKVSRIARLLFSDKAASSAFLNKIFTRRELSHLQARFPQLSNAHNDNTQAQIISQHVAGRFAAKEAIIKACTWKRLFLHDVEIARRDGSTGIYGIILDKPSSKTEEFHTTSIDTTSNGQVVQVSISHEDDYATAVCIAAVEPTQGDVGGEAAARQP